MVQTNKARWGTVAAAAVALLLVLLLGLRLRLQDPLSSSVVAAEDPYTHMALVREHLRDGHIDPLNEGGALYPPGMHAFIGAVWVYTGWDLYEMFRVGAVVWGGIGIIGIALLVSRSEGPIAGVVAALLYALAPEVIFRTSMMAPTAMDLALIPFLLYAFIPLLQGRLAWAAVAAPLALFLTFAHPWALLVLALAGVIFAVLAILHPWPRERGQHLTTAGLAVAVALMGACVALSLTGCWGGCGPGMRDVVADGARYNSYGPFLAAIAFGLAGLLFLARRKLDPILMREPSATPNMRTRTAASIALAVLLLAITLPALQIGLPNHVNLVRMFGWPIVGLAAFAVIMIPFVPSPGAHIGLGVSAATYPFVIYNPLHSPFWPHRTAVYLGIGLVLLASVGALSVTRAIAETFTPQRARLPAGAGRASGALAVMPLVLVGLSLGGAVYAGTPPVYPDGWYRLFTPCQINVLSDVSQAVSTDPTAIVITGDWQAKLVVAALTTNASRVWFHEGFFNDTATRKQMEGWMVPSRRPIYTVIDSYVIQNQPHADRTWTQSQPWEPYGSACPPSQNKNTTLEVYAINGGAR